jgi:predicted transcriptional regulator
MAYPSTSFRLDPALLARVDSYAEQLARETGLPVSSTAALAKLLTLVLDQVERPRTEMAERDAARHAARVADPSRGRRRKR